MDSPDSPDRAFSPTFLRRLDRLRLAARQTLAVRRGNAPVPAASEAAGMEIAGHASYSAGDELRHVDWNAYARLDQLLVKRFQAEHEAPLHIFIDTSASMGSPEEDRKLPFALAVAAGLAYIALRAHDPVRVVSLGGATLHSSPWFRHIGRFPQIHAWLVEQRAEGAGNLAESMRTYLENCRIPGLAVVLSDFLAPQTVWENVLAPPQTRGFEVAAVRVLGPLERNPPAGPARVRLHDVETGAERFVNLTQENRAAYVQALENHLAQLREWCAARGILFAVAETLRGVESFFLHVLTAAGLIR